MTDSTAVHEGRCVQQARAVSKAGDPMRAAFCSAVMSTIQPLSRQRIPGVLDALGVPPAFDDPALTKAKFIESRLALLADRDVPGLVERFLVQHGPRLSTADRFELEELAWANGTTIGISKRARYDVARALEGTELFLRSAPFLDVIARFWDRSSPIDIFLGEKAAGVLARVERHVVLNPDDWSVHELFEQLGAYDASDRRFALFLEALVSPDVRPNEASQRAFVAVVNGALAGAGVELREVGSEGGFPLFQFVAIGRGVGRAKNVIFASRMKPDLRLRDAVSNDIEIVTQADQVLVFDRPIPGHGLLWRDLQAWWADLQSLEDKEAKRSLYKRLLGCLPDNSPPQTVLFEAFFKHFGPRVPELPALLPEVWLHWDPKTVRERGLQALTCHRMDFLMLLPSDTRVVFEVDGLHHYANDMGAGDPARYAAMAGADRELRLAGYDVYRFGATELDANRGLSLVGDFFDRLFRRYGVATTGTSRSTP